MTSRALTLRRSESESFHVISPVDKTKLSCFTHQSFCRNLSSILKYIGSLVGGNITLYNCNKLYSVAWSNFWWFSFYHCYDQTRVLWHCPANIVTETLVACNSRNKLQMTAHICASFEIRKRREALCIRNRKTEEKIVQNRKTAKKFAQNRKPHTSSTPIQ